jgi:cysteine desulfuration protein SufE
MYPKKLHTIIKDLSALKDPGDRMGLLISYADKFKEVPEEIAKRPFPKENEVPFCESGAYVWVNQQPDGTIKLYFAVENTQGISAMALAAILDRTLSGETPENLLEIDEHIVEDIFGQALSMGKNMGLTGMLQKIKREARKYLNQSS